MKGFRRGEKGFTLIELLIVVAILGVLAAVVIPNVVGLMGRGGAQAYETDSEVIQLATSTFFSDVHGGWVWTGNASASQWGCAGQNYDPGNVTTYNPDLQDTGHYYPTALATVGAHTLVLNNDANLNDPQNINNPRIDVIQGTEASASDIAAHAIWMGLLVEAPGDGEGTLPDGLTTRGTVSVLSTETGLYLQNMPESAKATDSANGAALPGGGYCWVVGKNGSVFGAYQALDDTSTLQWYNGFSGAYP